MSKRPPPRLTNQIKGILLEEAVLVLLRRSGYRTVEGVGQDDTLGTCAAGLQVKGRGGEHQIDAIADFLVVQPFAYPQRLLVEAKCFAKRPVDLEIVRNALGVFRDVCEYWKPPSGSLQVPKGRYSYRYAIFAASNFTEPAQRFAYAHDIHLLPLGKSGFFRLVIEAVEQSAREIAPLLGQGPEEVRLRHVRALARRILRGESDGLDEPRLREPLAILNFACAYLSVCYIAMAGGVFPLFLVPGPTTRVEALGTQVPVRVGYDRDTWYFHRGDPSHPLFTFDLPEALFDMYAESGVLQRGPALQLKQDYLAELQLIDSSADIPRLVTLRLEEGWVDRMRRRVAE